MLAPAKLIMKMVQIQPRLLEGKQLAQLANSLGAFTRPTN
uniref:Uncharacterized protein n=1 Tax=Picea glauca TaxID=3330 RepID=A0A101M4V0_PICGL|nr:hypothetical protein ABT39_MTgene765 [Picea glauca]QHR90483.1 hypothetical protein Q903MT_gene4507 [Picea sitchensis]